MLDILELMKKDMKFIGCKIDRDKYYNEHRYEVDFIYKYKTFYIVLHYIMPITISIKLKPRKNNFVLVNMMSMC